MWKIDEDLEKIVYDKLTSGKLVMYEKEDGIAVSVNSHKEFMEKILLLKKQAQQLMETIEALERVEVNFEIKAT